jgi:hypothetical protein
MNQLAGCHLASTQDAEEGVRSGVSRERFNLILPLLEGVRRHTKPRTVNLYEVFCGVLYLLTITPQQRGDFSKRTAQ